MTGTERKVFQKYYPPDFDPSKIPKARGVRNRQFIQRVMAPFNMQCNTCNEYIYKGKKFNMRRETAEGESYLGMKIFRFYFRCPNCLGEITFKTDIENIDYKAEHGASRLFDAFKTYQEQERDKEQQEEEEKGNAMKLLEKRTKMSKIEMEALEKLEELQDVNLRNEKTDTMKYLEDINNEKNLSIQEFLKRQEEEDEKEVKKLFNKTESGRIERRINDKNDDFDFPITNNKCKNVQKISIDSDGFAVPPLPRSTSSTIVFSAPKKPEKKVPKFMKGVIIKKKS